MSRKKKNSLPNTFSLTIPRLREPLRPELSAVRMRILLLAGTLAYVACFQWMYVNYLYPFWEYFGFDYNPPATSYIVFAWLLSVIPSLWMPLKLSRPSQFAYWVLYITVFIPSMFVPLYAGLNSPREILDLMIVLFAGFAVAGGSYLLPLFRFRFPGIPRGWFWKGFLGLAVALTLWMSVVFRHHAQIVSFQDIYDVRYAANDFAEGSQVNYAFMLLTGAINPFLMGYGLFGKRVVPFLAGAAGQLFIYAVGGTKGSILSIFFIAAIALLFKVGRTAFALKTIFSALAILGLTSFSYVATGYDPGRLLTIALFVVLMRTLSTGGLLTAQYFDFFQHNPFTYYSHVKGVNWFLAYPYQYPLGEEIGLAYAGTTDLDASAHFWATDGIGGFGLPGILLISVLCAAVFWILDSVSQRHDPRFAALVTAYAAYNIANISLFTSLLSGGLALLILLLYLKPQEGVSNLDRARTTVNCGTPLFHGAQNPMSAAGES